VRQRIVGIELRRAGERLERRGLAAEVVVRRRGVEIRARIARLDERGARERVERRLGPPRLELDYTRGQ
jgi:hypothetical protein